MPKPRIKACRACLVTDVKMYSMEDSFISNAYINLTGVIIFESPNHICFECYSLLKKCEYFRLKCMRAHEVLESFIKQNIELTQDGLMGVDRESNNIDSLLKLSPLDTCDIYPAAYDTGYDISNENIPPDVMKKEEYDQLDLEAYRYLKVELEPLKLNDDKHVVLLSCDDIDNYDVSDDQESQNGAVSKEMNRKRKLKQSKEKVKASDLNDDEHDNKPLLSFDDSDDYDVNDDRDSEYTPVTKVSKKRKLAPRKSKAIVKKSNVDRRKKVKTESDHDTESKSGKASRVKKGVPVLDEEFFKGYSTMVILTPEQAKNEVLERKHSRNYKNCQYKCDFCYRGYENQVTYKNHMKKHDSDNGPHTCTCCYMTFPALKYLSRHQQTCHRRKFFCQICPYTCASSNQARSHVNLHKGTKYPCKVCGEEFSMRNSMLMHKRIKHATECVCDLCGSTFSTELGVKVHKKMQHKQETNAREGPECEECDVHFSNDTAWKRHLILSSRHGVSHGCEMCGESFKTALRLKNHARKHARPKRIEDTDASDCVCEVCGKTFKKTFFLAMHMRLHTGEKPVSCEKCGKKFRTSMALWSHSHKHLAKPRYRCKICSKQLKYSSSLHAHMKVVHQGLRPHKCPVCGKSFPMPHNVRVHMRRMHEKQDAVVEA